MKKLSIIIVTYNSQEYIIDCLKSIFDTSDIKREELEIIVVDNSPKNSFEETKKLITEIYGSEIIIIENVKNGGYGQGNNLGVSYAKAEIICIVNPDVLFVNPIFRNMLNIFKKNNSLAMIGGKQIGGRDISFWIRPEYEFFLFTAPLSKFLNVVNLYFQNFFYLSGALLFIDKNKFIEIGKFDEEIFMYCEEADLTKRFINKNYKTIYRKDYVYRHLIDERTVSSDKSIHQLINSYKIYFFKNKFNYKAYINRRILSFKLIILIGKTFGSKNLIEKNRKYLDIFQQDK